MRASSELVVWYFRCIMKTLKAKQFGCSTKIQSRRCAFWATPKEKRKNACMAPVWRECKDKIRYLCLFTRKLFFQSSFQQYRNDGMSVESTWWTAAWPELTIPVYRITNTLPASWSRGFRASTGLSFDLSFQSGFKFHSEVVIPDNDALEPALYQGFIEGLRVCGLLLNEILQPVDAGNLCVSGHSVHRRRNISTEKVK